MARMPASEARGQCNRRSSNQLMLCTHSDHGQSQNYGGQTCAGLARRNIKRSVLARYERSLRGRHVSPHTPALALTCRP
jgi:hypothetical protein